MLVDFKDAYRMVLESNIKIIGSQRVDFSSSLHRVLARDIIAEQNMPLCAVSNMDGYAFSFDDYELLKNQGLRILDFNPAGSQKTILQRGGAIKTLTGAMMPENSDTIVIIEQVEQYQGMLKLKDNTSFLQRGQWVRQVGDHYCQGEKLLDRGTRIRAYEIGLLAELNQSFVSVYQKPKVGILSSGNEVIEVGQERDHLGQVRSVNQHLLSAMIQEMGGIPIIKEICQDDFEMLERLFVELLEECDLIVTTGGMSKGDFDFTQDVIKKYANVEFHGINVKPGKPTLFAMSKQKQPKPILGLPGNPNASALMFYLFGGAIIEKFFGLKKEIPQLKAVLDTPIKRSDSRLEFRSLELRIKDGVYYVSEESKKSNQSAIINNLCNQSALAVLKENDLDLDKGSQVDIILF